LDDKDSIIFQQGSADSGFLWKAVEIPGIHLSWNQKTAFHTLVKSDSYLL